MLAFFKTNKINIYSEGDYGLNKYTNPKLSLTPSAGKLRSTLLAESSGDARNQIAMLFDTGTFVETSAYTQRAYSDYLTTESKKEFEGVITGYGAIDGKLTFAFVEDAERMGGYVDAGLAKKICDLYSLAISNGAPVIGVFNSTGTNIFEGTGALAAYGRIIASVNKASGVIPQIAYVSGKCIGTSAAIASMFDIIVKADSASLYVSSPTLTGIDNAQDAIVAFTGEEIACAGYIRSIISFLPSNSSLGIRVNDCADNLNRLLGELDFGGDALAEIAVIADNAVYYELGHGFAKSAVCAFSTVGGVKCGIVANSFATEDGKLSRSSARKIARFVNLCDRFNLPVVTLVDSLGLAIDKENEDTFAPELANLGFAYASSTCPKVTVILGHAIGASFILLGSKALGADLVYALDNAEIGALSAESGVAFAWDKYITEEKTREELISEWRNSVSSVAHAAASGEIDDIISTNELRARICSALLMLSSKGAYPTANRKLLPL